MNDIPAPNLRVWPREDHPISRKQISPNALRVLYKLRDAGHAGYLVGGAVRDLLIGQQPKDFDVATDATPEQVRALFRNCRLIGRRFRLAHVLFGKEIIEVATFRAPAADGDEANTNDEGRILHDNVYGTIEEDAVRRDFTANALYYAIEDFSVRDYLGGFEDIQQRLLRLIGNPEQRYREDPVRMLRAVRLAAKLGFSIEPATEEPIPRLAALLEESSNARLFDECMKLFMTGHAEASFHGLERLGLLAVLFPELARAMQRDVRGGCRNLIVAALRSTDSRVQSEQSVTFGFLLAALLWPAYVDGVQGLLAAGHPMSVAEQRSADRVIVHQCKRVAIPRRISLIIEELWFMQSRLATRQRKRVLRILAHPRFRAAYDFLLLRADAAPQLAADAAFWTAMQADGSAREAALEAAARAPVEQVEAEPGKRRRRRRRKPAGASAS